MKVLHIMASRQRGGAEIYSADVIGALHHAGVDQVVVMHQAAPRFDELRSVGIRLAPDVLSIPLHRLQRWKLGRLLASENPDVVHCWMGRAASLVTRTHKPVIGWLGGYYNPRFFQRCTLIVGVTEDIVDRIQQSGRVASASWVIPTFPDIVSAEPIDRGSLGTPNDAKLLLTLSRMHPKKGLDTLLRAMVELPHCYLWMAGDGPIRRQLETLAADLGVLDRVRFLGWRSDRSALLYAADVCVLPSRFEPFGTVILEAWAARTPLVACKSAGPAAHIEDGVTGLLSPIDDPSTLATTVLRALGDDELRRRLKTRGHARYTETYTREAVIEKWLDLYRSLTERPAAAPGDQNFR